MGELSQEHRKYIDQALEWLNQHLHETVGADVVAPLHSEELFQVIVAPFSRLLKDPISHSHDKTETFPDGAAIGSALHLQAVGIHCAGDSMPSGRHSAVEVDYSALNKSAKRCHLPSNKKHASAYLALFNGVYSKYLGRHRTLIHTLLHGTKDCGRVIVMPLSDRDLKTKYSSDINGLEAHSLPTGKIFSHLIDNQLRKSYVKALWDNAPAAAETLKTIIRDQKQSKREIDSGTSPREITELYVNRIAELLHTETDTEGDTYSFCQAFDRNVVLTRAKLEEDHDSGKTLVTTIYGNLENVNKPNLSKRIEEAAKMLQMFYLYKDICGEYFYVIVPKSAPDLRMCFTIGTSTELTETELDFLVKLAICVQGCVSAHTTTLRAGNEKFESHPDKKKLIKSLRDCIGIDNADMLSFEGIGQSGHHCRITDYLGHYLDFCHRISDIAVHEGKSLKFNIVVGDGVFASAKLAKVSSLTADSTSTWTIRDSDDLPSTASRRRYISRGEVIARIMGNYSFFQQSDFVLYGCREGNFLYLARTLDGTLKPEELTKKEEKDINRCFLIQIKAGGEICVFYDGRLLLWRRAGRYVIPTEYGNQYKSHLKKWFVDNVSIEMSKINFDVLVNAVWSLSADRKGGATFVLGRVLSGPFPLEKNVYELTSVFPHAEGLPLLGGGNLRVLEDLAVQDGAVIIDLDTGRVYGRRHIRSERLLKLDDHLSDWKQCNGRNAWPDWYKILYWGTRHHSALAFTATAKSAQNSQTPSVVVVTVSSDGDIHVFCGKRPVTELTYPQPKKSGD